MKTGFKLIAKIAKKSAELSLKRDANNTTCGAIYQPVAPKDLQRFKRQHK